MSSTSRHCPASLGSATRMLPGRATAYAERRPLDRPLSIRTRTTDDDLPAGCHVHIEVKDMGPAIPEDVIEKAFDPFFTTKFLGRGLGLSAVLAKLS
jgi:two-component system, cell cycle sensor histidine kinase and response regulator CckA